MTENNNAVDKSTEIEVTKAAASQAEKIQELMNEGKTLAEALTIVGTKAPRVPVDRVALIKAMTNLVEIRKARKTAYAKKSKSKDNAETSARYQLEIEAASERLNEILALVNASETPWKTALEYGDSTDGALQYFITSVEQELTEYFSKVQLTKAQLKGYLQTTKPNRDFVPAELAEPFKRRLENRDQRLYTLAIRYQLKQDLESGATKPEADKVTKGETTGEAAPEETPKKGSKKAKKAQSTEA